MKPYFCAVLLLSIAAQNAVFGAGNYVAPTVLWTAETSDWGSPSVAIQPNGNLVVGSFTSSYTAVLTSYSPNGNQLWRTTIGAAGETRADNVQVDSTGNIYVAGSTYVSSYSANKGAADVTLQKFNPNGILQWGKQFGTPQFDWSSGLAVTPNGTSYITSGGWATNYSGSPAGSYTTIHQYLSDGTAGWVANLNTGDGTSPGASAEGAEGTSLDPSGNVVAAFSNYTSTTSNNIQYLSFYNYLSKTNASGQVQWIKSLNTSPVATAINSLGDTYVSGGYLEEFDPSGNLIWSVQNNYLDFQAICLGPDGTLYATERDSDSIYTYDSSGDLLSTVTVPHPTGSIVAFDDMTISGDELAATALLANGSYTSGNELVLLSIPEPNAMSLIILAASAFSLSRFHKKTERPFRGFSSSC